jgi:hypothetical protein
MTIWPETSRWATAYGWSPPDHRRSRGSSTLLEAHGRLPSRIAEQGGRVVAGLGLEPSDTATAIRGDLITDGPFIEARSTS